MMFILVNRFSILSVFRMFAIRIEVVRVSNAKIWPDFWLIILIYPLRISSEKGCTSSDDKRFLTANELRL